MKILQDRGEVETVSGRTLLGILAIRRNGTLISTPAPYVRVQAGDGLVVYGSDESIGRFQPAVPLRPVLPGDGDAKTSHG